MSTKKVLLAIAGLTSLLPGVVSTNCRGSFFCPVTCPPDAMAQLQQIVSDAVDVGMGEEYFETGEHIACVRRYSPDGMPIDRGGCCAFYQHKAFGDLNNVKLRIDNLVEHGCTTCGSDPTEAPGHVEYGELTVNFVYKTTDCDGRICGGRLPPFEQEYQEQVENGTAPKPTRQSESNISGVRTGSWDELSDEMKEQEEEEGVRWYQYTVDPPPLERRKKPVIPPDERTCMVLGRKCKPENFTA